MEKNLKQEAGEHAARFVDDGMVVGLGTGSTVAYTIKKIGEMVGMGLEITGIPTSLESEKLAEHVGIKLSTLESHPEVDLTIDGADEVDPNLDLIKGMGGALLREKLVAKASREEIIVADESKLVERLGTKSPLPVEVLPFGWSRVGKEIEKLGCIAVLRESDGESFISDNGNYILDCRFESIDEPVELEMALNNITGVIENGLFLGIATKAIIARQSGIEELNRKR
jgi:ribose 5-phosphate isomerase A